MRLIPAHAGKTQVGDDAGKHERAHPRSRGENSAASRLICQYAGSSPLTRGKPYGTPMAVNSRGLIPAHAGKTSTGSWRINRSQGSSPLTRGKRGGPPASRLGDRLIPAHAGKTTSREAAPCCPGAHPRSRGENLGAVGGRGGRGGSSPLTRGKRWTSRRRCAGPGLIPAHAGKTRRPGPDPGRSWAHPRSRGENGSRRSARMRCKGSSPLTRGKRVSVCVVVHHPGLIPAHAGKTHRPPALRRHGTAHPRSRGENPVGGGATGNSSGSSPLTRGKPSRCVLHRLCRGLIPAHAGKTLDERPSFGETAAHPRSRGENNMHTWSRQPRSGSSPLTRGKRRSCTQGTIR